MPEFCEVGTLVRTQGHNVKGWGKVLAVEGSHCTITWQTEKQPSSLSLTEVLLLFVAFQVRIMHQKPLCIPSLNTQLLNQKRPYGELVSRIPRRRVI